MKIIPYSMLSESIGTFTSGITKSIKKLSYGVSSGDSVRTSRISVVDSTCSNMQDGISLFRVAGDALREVHELLADARSECADSIVGSGGTGENVLSHLASDVDEKLSAARFGGSSIFEEGEDVSPEKFSELTGKIVSGLIDGRNVKVVGASSIAHIDAESLGLSSLNDERTSAISAIDSAIGLVVSLRTVLEARVSHMEDVAQKIAIKTANVVAAGSRIIDTDEARAAMANTKMKILKKPLLSLAGQANQLHGNIAALIR